MIKLKLLLALSVTHKTLYYRSGHLVIHLICVEHHTQRSTNDKKVYAVNPRITYYLLVLFLSDTAAFDPCKNAFRNSKLSFFCMARRNRKENKMADQQALAFSKWLKIKNAVL